MSCFSNGIKVNDVILCSSQEHYIINNYDNNCICLKAKKKKKKIDEF